METLQLSAKCERKNVNEKNSVVVLAVDLKDEAPAAPGQPNRRTAKTIIQINFTDAGADEFKPGSSYKIVVSPE